MYKFLLLTFMFVSLNAFTLPQIENIKKDIDVYPFETIVLYPKVKDISLNELDVKYEQLSGRVLQTLYTKDKILHIKVPSDIGKDEDFTFKITLSKGVHKKSIQTTLHLKTNSIQVVQTEDDGYPNDCDEDCQKKMDNEISDLKIIRTSINQRGIYENSSDEFMVEFKSDSGTKVDLGKFSHIVLFDENKAYKVKEYFIYNEVSNILSVKNDKLEKFKNILKEVKGAKKLVLSLYDKNKKSLAYSINFHYGFATITGSLQDDKTKKGITYLQNSLIEIKDSKNHFSFEAYLDKNGDFRVENIPAGFYFISFYSMDLKFDAWNHLDIDSSSDIYTMILYINEDGGVAKNNFVQEKIIDVNDDIKFKRMQHGL